jgi:uncharacterized protein (DUF433 family)
MYRLINNCIEINPHKCSGFPVILGTKFTISQLLAEIADGRSLPEISEHFDLDLETIQNIIKFLSLNVRF